MFTQWTKFSNDTAAKASELERKFVFVVNNKRKGGEICWLVLIHFVIFHLSSENIQEKQTTLYLIHLSEFVQYFSDRFDEFCYYPIRITCRSLWPCAKSRRCAAAYLLGLRFRIPPRAWMSVSCECCVLSGRCLCDGPITCPEESYRLCCVWVWSQSLND